MFRSFFNIYIYIYISIYILKKEQKVLHSFAKEQNIFAFFYVLIRSFEKNGKEQNVLLGLISRQKLKKRTGKNGTFFKRTGKNGTS